MVCMSKSKQSDPSYEEQIEQIMIHFNFEDCHRYFKDRGHTYYNTCIGDMRVAMKQTALKMLKSVAYDKSGYSSSGCFTARRVDGVLSLSFYIEELSAADILDFGEDNDTLG